MGRNCTLQGLMAAPSPGGLSPRQHPQTGRDLQGCWKPSNCTLTISQTAAVHVIPLGYPGVFIASVQMSKPRHWHALAL